MIFSINKSKRYLVLGIISCLFTFTAAYSLPWSWDMWSQDSIQPYEEPVLFPRNSISTEGNKTVLEDREKIEAITKSPLPATTESLKKGEEIFKYNCVVCHGPQGKGDGIIIKKGLGFYPVNLSAPLTVNRTDGFIYAYIRHGGKVMMPSYSENISKEDAWHLVNYIRKLQKEK